MAINVECPVCGKSYRRIRPELVGKKAQCVCGNTFRLGEPSPDDIETSEAVIADSIDLSSASVFENSYGDLDQILSGHGSTAPLPTRPIIEESAIIAEQPLARKTSNPTAATPQPKTQSTDGYGGTGMSVGFIAAVLSGCAAIWFSLFVLASRYEVIQFQPLNLVSQTLHDASQATFGDLVISQGLERSFVLLGWVIWVAAACLLCLAVGQLVNAFVKLFLGRRLLPGIDGITGLTATVMLFLLLSTIFFHFSHMRQLNRDLVQKAGGQIDETTVLGRNLQQLQSNHADHSRHFMISMIVASSVPLCICLLSLSRVYVTLGEAEVTPSRRESP